MIWLNDKFLNKSIFSRYKRCHTHLTEIYSHLCILEINQTEFINFAWKIGQKTKNTKQEVLWHLVLPVHSRFPVLLRNQHLDKAGASGHRKKHINILHKSPACTQHLMYVYYLFLYRILREQLRILAAVQLWRRIPILRENNIFDQVYVQTGPSPSPLKVWPHRLTSGIMASCRKQRSRTSWQRNEGVQLQELDSWTQNSYLLRYQALLWLHIRELQLK